MKITFETEKFKSYIGKPKCQSSSRLNVEMNAFSKIFISYIPIQACQHPSFFLLLLSYEWNLNLT